jgi:hypothetical protein
MHGTEHIDDSEKKKQEKIKNNTAGQHQPPSSYLELTAVKFRTHNAMEGKKKKKNKGKREQKKSSRSNRVHQGPGVREEHTPCIKLCSIPTYRHTEPKKRAGKKTYQSEDGGENVPNPVAFSRT